MNERLADLQQRAREAWESLHSSGRPRILVGTAACGRSAGALKVLDTFRRQLEDRRLEAHLIEVGCMGLCYAEPVVGIARPGQPLICYGSVTPDRAAEVLERCLVRGELLPDLALGSVGEQTVAGVPRLLDTPVFRPQVRRILRHCGFIDPSDIHHYLAHGGYSGLAKALEVGPEEVIGELQRSGLRGRGGAGFPTWRKWRLAHDTKAAKKFVVCNGSEGDPGVFSNRVLMESDPHSVLEGILIAGYAVGADEAYIYCPAESPLALERLQTAVAQMQEHGLLGEGILGSSFTLHITITQGAGAYVCGEETALLEFIQGRRGVPQCRPPFPPVSGLAGFPTVVNNVETLACATLILRYQGRWFAELGTGNHTGTKLVCLSGNICRSGVAEVPFGIPLRELLSAAGGGATEGTNIKAVHLGGPAGGVLPPDRFDVPLDQDSLLTLGASLGSGGVVVIGEDTCMVDLARNSLDFSRQACCGRCVPCRLGTEQLYRIVDDIASGQGEGQDLTLLAELSEGIKLGSLCGLGQTAPNTLLSTLRYFRDEYEAHIQRRECPAAVCVPAERLAFPADGPTRK